MGAPRDAMLRIFMAIGLSIGIAGTAVGMIIGFSLLYFRQGVLRGAELLTGQPLWDPSIRFLTELPSKHHPVEIVGIAVMARTEDDTTALTTLLRISYAVFCLKKKKKQI